MPTVRVSAQLTTNDLLTAAKQLPPEDLRDFLQKAARWQARQDRALVDDGGESALVAAATEKLPVSTERRLKLLLTRSREGTITPKEHEELLQITDSAEHREAQRLEALSELARRRGVDLSEMMRQLGLTGSRDVL